MKLRVPAVLTALVGATALSLSTLSAAEAAPPPAVTGLQVTGQLQGDGKSWEVSASWEASAGADRYIVAVVDQADGTNTAGSQYGNDSTSSTAATVEATKLLSDHTYWVAVRPSTGSEIGTVAVVPFAAIALDEQGPTGTFSVPITTGWIGEGYEDFRALTGPFRAGEDIYWDEDADTDTLIGFQVKQTALADDTTATNQIVRQIRLDTGRPAQLWKQSPATLVYHSAGTYHPEVVLTDQYGNVSTISLPAITVSLDNTAPVIRITRPRPALRGRIGGWRVIRGTLVDHQSGPALAGAMVAQRRGRIWWVYDFDEEIWVKGFPSLPRSLSETEAFPAFTAPFGGHWRTPFIRDMQEGILHVETFALDEAMNVAFGPTIHRPVSRAR